MKDIEEFLRENKPVPQDNPSFILEAMEKMESVEGIKAEVDRQRHHGRRALIHALAAGLAVGVLITALAFLYPIDTKSVGEGLWQSVRLFLETWKQYLIFPVAILAVALALAVSLKDKDAIRL